MTAMIIGDDPVSRAQRCDLVREHFVVHKETMRKHDGSRPAPRFGIVQSGPVCVEKWHGRTPWSKLQGSTIKRFASTIQESHDQVSLSATRMPLT